MKLLIMSNCEHAYLINKVCFVLHLDFFRYYVSYNWVWVKYIMEYVY